MKKTLAILLSLAMVLAMIPMYTGVAYADAQVAISNSNSSIAITSTGLTYNGKAQAPTIEVTLNGAVKTSGWTTLTYVGKKYETDTTADVSAGGYSSTTAPTEAGVYFVKIEASNANFKGTVTSANFAIAPRDITGDKMVILSPNVEYTGAVVVPNVSVNDQLVGRQLTKGTDYTVSAVTNGAVKAGSSSDITIEGINNYKGTASRQVGIDKADIVDAVITAPGLANQLSDMTIASSTVAAADGSSYYPVTLNSNGKQLISVKINGVEAWDKTNGTLTAAFKDDAVVNFYSESSSSPSKIIAILSLKTSPTNLTNTNKVKSTVVNYVKSSITLYTDISNCYFSSSKASLTYNGTSQTPEITVKTSSSGTTLTKKTDYTVEYVGDMMNVGSSAYISIKGLTGYYGEKQIPVVISARKISESGVTVTLPSTIEAGTDPADSGKLVVKDSVTGTATALTYGVDYDVEYRLTSSSGTEITNFSNYSGITESKTVWYKITGKGNYAAGTSYYKSGTFTMVPAGNTIDSSNITVTSSSLTYNGKTQTADITVTDPSNSSKQLVEGTAYTVSYYKYLTDSTVSTTATTPKDAGYYDIVITGKGSYAGTIRYTKGLTINAYNWDSGNVMISALKNGSSFIVTVTSYGTSNTVSFTQGTDFNVKDISTTYANQVRITPIAGSNLTYSSTSYKDVYYTVSSTTVTKFTVTPLSPTTTSVGYQAAGYTPTYTVYAGSTKLTQGSDYSIAYYSTYTTSTKTAATAPLTTPGTYTVVITGLSGYSTLTTYTTSFTIAANSISAYTVTLKETTVKATGVAQTPTISSVMNADKTIALTAGTDYEVTYKNAAGTVITASQIINPGTYTVVVTGKGNYTGSANATFTIYGDPQYITVNTISYTKYRGSDGFDLGAVCSTSTLSYESSDTAVVQVTQSGIAYMAGKVGTATITITAPATSKLEKATKTITIVSKPYKGTVKKVTSTAKGKLKAIVKKQTGCTGYQVCVSRYSSFKAGSRTFATITDNPIYTESQSKTITGLTSGKTYYVKARAIYTINGVTKYGNWSTVKTVKVK